MSPRVRFSWSKKPIEVATSRPECPGLACFHPAEHIIRSPTVGYSGTFSRPTGEYRCQFRETHGCPADADRVPGKRFKKARGVWREAPDLPDGLNK